MTTKSTRLRYISSSSEEELEAAVQMLPFKIEIKSLVYKNGTWYCWFVLPDNITNLSFAQAIKALKAGEEVDVSSLKLEQI